MCLPKFRNDVCDTRGADISVFSGRRVDLIGVVNENHEKLIFSSRPFRVRRPFRCADLLSAHCLFRIVLRARGRKMGLVE